MRLDKYISNSTDLTRSEVKRMIRHGIVEVDNEIVTNAAQHIVPSSEVTVDGAVILASGPRYFMLNKPAGVVSVTKDKQHPTALSLIHEHRSEELQIAGRLDIDTTGLLLITSDGQWNHRVTSPRTECAKVYAVTLADPIEHDYSAKLSQGVFLKNEKQRCLPASMEKIDSHCLTLTISEGKYHQVKRMFAALGNQVVALHRFKVGNIQLDNNLAEGDYRPLTKQEVNSVV